MVLSLFCRSTLKDALLFIASSKGPVPELEYDGSTGKGTLRWTGPPAIVNDYKSYSIKFASVYPGTTVEPSALTFESIENVSLPYSSDVAALTMYIFTIAATVGNDSVTSDYANVSTGGRGSSKGIDLIYSCIPIP